MTTGPPSVDRLVHLPDRYRVERVLGRGGSGVVVAAVDTALQRPVAIKVFTRRPDRARALLEQEREARLLAGFNHPGLVTVYDVGVDVETDPANPRAYLVMERIDGPDLSQWLRASAPSSRQVAQIAVDLIAALQYVHQHGYLHRDIKPSNVLLEITRPLPRAKLTDFGLATGLDGAIDGGEFTLGTAAYLSPEQAEGSPLREGSDTYALGLVLLEALTREVPFPGPVLTTARARLEREPEIDAGIPTALATALRGMTRRHLPDRWGLEDCLQAFQRFLTDAGATPRPPAARPGATAPWALNDDAELTALLRLLVRLLRADGAAILSADGTVTRATILAEHHFGPGQLDSVGVTTRTTRERASADRSIDARPEVHGRLLLAPILDSSGAVTAELALLRADETLPTLADLTTLGEIAEIAGRAISFRSATRRALFSR